jgi:plastocyanin domain-containing protein
MTLNLPKFDYTLLLIPLAIAFILLLGFFASANLNSGSVTANDVDNSKYPFVKDGVQYASVNAKDGFNPGVLNLQANIPTVLELNTLDTYDCSNTLLIPSLKIAEKLPITGKTSVEIPPQEPGASITATCGMGHYSLKINFL